ncbi:MAG: UDP-3-O-(3-hydroxymyristoyl)glucosamine N-acyltransferase, partial [Firmicutes bacterium]|nr:UDP-3-O-(3-hydroxymyristoyl)glucosamine N-acyltransferase [Bacillota bacterium]
MALVGVDAGDEQRIADGDVQASALADGVAGHALVLAQNAAVHVDDLAGQGALRADPVDHRGVLALGHETDVLAVGLVGDGQAQLGRDVAIHPFAYVGDAAVIGDGCTLYPGAVVGARCVLGTGVILHPHVVLYDDTQIGARTEIHAGSVIGGDGFGYRLQDGRHVKVPQTGRVVIGEDVEIGANCTIDRGTFEATEIGDGSKIDNLVMIGHNNKIGRHNILCGQVGIAGSCKTGDYVVMAGQAGIKDHVEIGDRAIVGAQAG